MRTAITTLAHASLALLCAAVTGCAGLPDAAPSQFTAQDLQGGPINFNTVQGTTQRQRSPEGAQ